LLVSGMGRLGVVVPLAVIIALSAALPVVMLVAFMWEGMNDEMRAKRRTVAAARRSAGRLDRKTRPVLTAEHVAFREKLDELFADGARALPKSERAAEADAIFALMLEDFENADYVLDLVESRGLYSADEVRAVMSGMRQVVKPLRDGAL
jgi:hypothetical protein